MIYCFVGENSFEISQAVRKLTADFEGTVERFEGGELSLGQLPDLLMGTSLFSDKRLVIIENLSDNKTIWEQFDDWAKRVSDDVTLVLVEAKPDKRTKVYKALQNIAHVQEFKAWSDWDGHRAEAWATEEAKRQKVALTPSLVRKLVERTGPDQWRLFHALEKLAVLDTVTPDIIDQVVEPSRTENVFALYETALKGDHTRLAAMLETLRRSEEPYRVFGLLTSQLLQTLALASTDAPADTVARDLGTKSKALPRLAPVARKLGVKRSQRLVAKAADIDLALKSTSTDPWVLVERLLYDIAAA